MKRKRKKEKSSTNETKMNLFRAIRFLWNVCFIDKAGKVMGLGEGELIRIRGMIENEREADTRWKRESGGIFLVR